MINGRDPAHGGLKQVLDQVAQQFGTVNAYAAGNCDSFSTPTLTPSTFTLDPGSDFSLGLSTTVTAGTSNPPDNGILLTATPPASYSGFSFSQFWNPANGNNASQGLITPATEPSGTTFTENANALMHIDPATPAGSYVFTVTANSTGGSCAPPTKTGTFTINVNAVASPSPGTVPSDFTIRDNPSLVGVFPGGSATTTVTASQLGSFNSDVTLTVSIPAALTGLVTVTPSPPGIIKDGNGSKSLGFSTDPSAPPGTYTITITGTSGALSHSTTLTLDIFSGTPSPTPASGGPPPKAHQIITTVVYYFTPITPGLGLFTSSDVIYVIGSATLEATY
jgi:hypothetical protein